MWYGKLGFIYVFANLLTYLLRVLGIEYKALYITKVSTVPVDHTSNL
jgi:hypothetical protein